MSESGLEVLTPRFLFGVGYGSAVAGKTLANALAVVAAEYGVLGEWQFEAVIDGHAAGVVDYAAYLTEAAVVPPWVRDTNEFPF